MPVAMTWNLSFEQVAQRNPAAADLLRVCAFLAPDAIPETIMTKGASQLGPQLAEMETDAEGLDEAVEVLRAYSLVRRDAVQETLSMHRLVQAVLRDQMTQEEQRQWAERVVQATNAAFPLVKHQRWSQCEVVVPHALVMASLIEQYEMTMPEAATITQSSSYPICTHVLVTQKRSRCMCERWRSESSSWEASIPTPLTASTIWQHCMIARESTREAEPLYVRALTICEQQLGAEHPYTAPASTIWRNCIGVRESMAMPNRCMCERWPSVSSTWDRASRHRSQPQQSGSFVQEPGKVWRCRTVVCASVGHP